MVKLSPAEKPKRNPPSVKAAASTQHAQRPSVILSAIATAGIVVFLVGVLLAVIGFFAPVTPTTSFSGQGLGMKLTTTNVGLAIAFLGALFVGLVRVLYPAGGMLFYEQDRRPWIGRTASWFGPASLAIALVALAALVMALVYG